MKKMDKYLLLKFFLISIIIFSCDDNPCKLQIEKEYYSLDSSYKIVIYSKDCGAIANGPIEMSIVKNGNRLPDESNFISNGLGLSITSWNNNEIILEVGNNPTFNVINNFGFKLKFVQIYAEKKDYYFSESKISKNIVTIYPTWGQKINDNEMELRTDTSNIKFEKVDNGEYYYVINNPIDVIDSFWYKNYHIKRIRHLFGRLIGKNKIK
jgi:hypothetical protein